MKLELKHIAPYLPHGLKIMTSNGIEELITLSQDTFNIKGRGLNYGMYDDIFNCTPILRPLSNLTKEELKVFGVDFRVAVKSNGNLDILKYLNYYEFEWLYQNHFDICGLIDQNLAIDVNTLD